MSFGRHFSLRRTLGASLVLPFALSGVFAGSKAEPVADVQQIVAEHKSSMGPMKLEGIKISNFGVVDGHIFRGAQPGSKDFTALKAIGVKTIIDLREDFKKDSRELAEAAGLKYINIPIDDHSTPSDEQAAAFLKAVDDPSNGVVYVHCAGGRHRTGSMVAVYRMARDRWTIDQAYDEMLAYDFYTSRGHGGFKTYVYDFYQRLTSAPQSMPAAFVAPQPEAVVAAARN